MVLPTHLSQRGETGELKRISWLRPPPRSSTAGTILLAPTPPPLGWQAQLPGWRHGRQAKGRGFVVNHNVNHRGLTLVTPPHSPSTDKAAVATTG